MIIIQLAGGLGNQMFQYALYLQLKNLDKTVKIDDESGFVQDKQRVPALAGFGVTYERPSRKELEEMLDSSPLLYHKIHRKLCGRKKKSYFEADKSYKPEILQWDDIYLEGYWQSEKYFGAVSEQVRTAFDTDRLLQYIRKKVPDILDKFVEYSSADEGAQREGIQEENTRKEIARKESVRKESAGKRIEVDEDESRMTGGRTLQGWLERIDSTESVSVHIRRGDYLLPENRALFGGICTDTYYLTAMERMMKRYPGCVFYLFTNDRQWAQQWMRSLIGGKQGCGSGMANTSGPDACMEKARVEIVDMTDIEDGGQDRDYAEFVLMSRCRHNILANSSFSWWASYLNRNSDKTVLAPDRWLNGWDCTDFYREDMIRIATAGIPQHKCGDES